MISSLSEFFLNANVRVAHDLLGAARATCGNEPGMVAILGTGSNSCLYDGSEIVANVPALGYVMGDEGSGSHLGKTFIKNLLYEKLDAELKNLFDKEYSLEITDILEAVYQQPNPNRFLAQFSKFIFKHQSNEFIASMTRKCFEEFFEQHITAYNSNSLELHLVGSIAYVYQDIIREVAKSYQIEIGRIIKQPISALVEYHQ